MTLEAQYVTLGIMSLSGAILGAVYDMYRVVLRHWKFLRWASPIFDFAFWIFSFLLVFWSLMWANDGDLRSYVFVVLGIGLLLYRVFFRKAVIGSTVGIIMGIRFIVLWLYRLFQFLIVNPTKELIRLLIGMLRAIDRLLQILEKGILWPFKPLHRILRFVAGPLVRLIRPYVRPVYRKMRSAFQRGKGIWAALTNWLLNRDDDQPKP